MITTPLTYNLVTPVVTELYRELEFLQAECLSLRARLDAAPADMADFFILQRMDLEQMELHIPALLTKIVESLQKSVRNKLLSEGVTYNHIRAMDGGMSETGMVWLSFSFKARRGVPEDIRENYRHLNLINDESGELCLITEDGAVV